MFIHSTVVKVYWFVAQRSEAVVRVCKNRELRGALMSKFDYFAKLPDGYECQLAQTDDDTADSCSTLRLNVKMADEWRTWLHKFEAESYTKFVNRNYSSISYRFRDTASHL